MKTRKKKVVYSGNQVNLPYMEFIQNTLFNMSHPVESIFETTDSSCNTPENLVNYFKTLFGVSAAGTWEVFGAGRTIIGAGSYTEASSTTTFTNKATGGSKYLQNHSHGFTPSGSVSSSFTGIQGTTSKKGDHNHSFTPSGSVSVSSNPSFTGSTGTTGSQSANHTHTFTPSGTIEYGGSHHHRIKTDYSDDGTGARPCVEHASEAGTTLDDNIMIDAGSHNHSFTGTQGTTGNQSAGHNHSFTPSGSISGGSYTFSGSAGTTSSEGDHTHTITPSGSVSSSFSGSQGYTEQSGSGEAQNLQPYIVVYRYRRIR